MSMVKNLKKIHDSVHEINLCMEDFEALQLAITDTNYPANLLINIKSIQARCQYIQELLEKGIALEKELDKIKKELKKHRFILSFQ